MSDEEKNLHTGTDADPQETEALQDLLSTPDASSQTEDSSVFDQNLFGAPPPSAAPSDPEPPTPETTQPPSPAETASPPEEEDVKIVTPDDFDKLGPDSPEPTPSPSTELQVEGSAAEMVDREVGSREDYPELVVSAPVAEAAPPRTPAPEPAPQEDISDEWELESPVDESASLDEAISAAAEKGDDIPIKVADAPTVFKAAKAKEGREAVEQARETIEKLDGEEEGFLDAGEIKQGMTLLVDLVKRIDELAARIEQLEAKLK